ncbi:hypothetical protein D1007_33352 [Hordeum vulgare]|nr:hypothetical protein D1007_33352 [Hordeum vulgare]
MSANQKVASMREQSSPDDPDRSALSVEQNMSARQGNGDTNHDMVDEVLSAPMEAIGNVDRAEQNNLVEANNPSAEILGSHDHPTLSENGYTDSNQGVPIQNAENIQTEKHLNKTRTYLDVFFPKSTDLSHLAGDFPIGAAS